MDVVYGIQVTGSTDRYITNAEKVAQMLVAAVLPGAFLVDLIPLRMSFRVGVALRVITYLSSETRARMDARSCISEIRSTRPKKL